MHDSLIDDIAKPLLDCYQSLGDLLAQGDIEQFQKINETRLAYFSEFQRVDLATAPTELREWLLKIAEENDRLSEQVLHFRNQLASELGQLQSRKKAVGQYTRHA